jgi:RNA polymerase sigma factor (sigma-70 family)
LLKEKPYIAYIQRLCAIEYRRMEGRLLRAYGRLQTKLLSHLRRKGLGTLEDAEDLAGRVWTELIHGVRSRRFRTLLDGILYRIAQHRFLDYVTQQRNRERLIRSWKAQKPGLLRKRNSEGRGEIDIDNDVVIQSPDIDTDILIRNLVLALPGDERAVVETIYLDGCTLQESASQLKISVSTVKRLQSRAMAWMRSQVA